MKLRPPTGLDCIWYQELLAADTPPNCVELIVRFTELTEEEAKELPAKEVWPLYRKAQDSIMEGFPSGEAD